MSDIGVLEHPPIPRTEKTRVNGEGPAPDSRQQSKIIGVIVRNDQRLIGEPSVQLNHRERGEYLRRVAQGRIGDAEYSKLLGSIKAPIANERDERNPVFLFSEISGDRQLKGIVAHFARGSLQSRDSLTPQDLHAFVRQRFPNALAFEKAVGGFLDQIERSNDKQKRAEYEEKVEELGSIVYGKQWEYLKQIKLLEEEARAGQPKPPGAMAENPQVRDAQSGLEQAQQFTREHRLKGRVEDGYKDGGRATRFDSQGRAINPSREVIVVDRQRDVRLQQMIEQAKSIQAQYGTGLKAAFELSKLVYEKMNDPRAVSIVESQFEATPGKEVLLGDITVENGSAGVCRHRSLLFQVLAAELGVSANLVRGNVAFGDYDISGGHAWNEVELYGRKYLIDIMKPPGSRKFKDFDYSAFMKQGGFPEIGINRSNYRYMDVNGVELYRV